MLLKLNLIILSLLILFYSVSRIIINRNKHVDIKKEVINLSLFMSMLVIVSATILPRQLGTGFREFEIYNLTPFKVVTYIYNNYSLEYFLYQTVGNFMLFIPFGFFSYCKFKSIKKAIILSLAMTLSVELIQGFIPNRFCDIDDIWLNTSGGILGSIAAYFLISSFNLISKNMKISDIES